MKENWKPGEQAHFEYHCYEGHDSADAELWYRSKEPVTILAVVTTGPPGWTRKERAEDGQPRCYSVRFADGFEGHVTEDELLESANEFDSHYTRGTRP